MLKLEPHIYPYFIRVQQSVATHFAKRTKTNSDKKKKASIRNWMWSRQFHAFIQACLFMQQAILINSCVCGSRQMTLRSFQIISTCLNVPGSEIPMSVISIDTRGVGLGHQRYISRMLKPGGLVMFSEYRIYDSAKLRFIKNRLYWKESYVVVTEENELLWYSNYCIPGFLSNLACD